MQIMCLPSEFYTIKNPNFHAFAPKSGAGKRKFGLFVGSGTGLVAQFIQQLLVFHFYVLVEIHIRQGGCRRLVNYHHRLFMQLQR